MEQFYIGQKFTGTYPPAAAIWCNQNDAHIERIDGDGEREYIIVENAKPTVEEQNEQIRQTRADLYSQLIDPLHAERQRKVVLGTWTDEMETAYVAKVKELTEQIQSENPYVVEG